MILDKEDFARLLHDAGRAAVIAGATVAAEKFGEKVRTFIEWDDLTETAKDGRRMQAQFLMDNFNITLSRKPGNSLWKAQIGIEWQN